MTNNGITKGINKQSYNGVVRPSNSSNNVNKLNSAL